MIAPPSDGRQGPYPSFSQGPPVRVGRSSSATADVRTSVADRERRAALASSRSSAVVTRLSARWTSSGAPASIDSSSTPSPTRTSAPRGVAASSPPGSCAGVVGSSCQEVASTDDGTAPPPGVWIRTQARGHHGPEPGDHRGCQSRLQQPRLRAPRGQHQHRYPGGQFWVNRGVERPDRAHPQTPSREDPCPSGARVFGVRRPATRRRGRVRAAAGRPADPRSPIPSRRSPEAVTRAAAR